MIWQMRAEDPPPPPPPREKDTRGPLPEAPQPPAEPVIPPPPREEEKKSLSTSGWGGLDGGRRRPLSAHPPPSASRTRRWLAPLTCAPPGLRTRADFRSDRAAPPGRSVVHRVAEEREDSAPWTSLTRPPHHWRSKTVASPRARAARPEDKMRGQP